MLTRVNKYDNMYTINALFDLKRGLWVFISIKILNKIFKLGYSIVRLN